eukprot:GFYU01021609.1.p1 GENE.GFYU01021609.1~~GFYU01021609.1.p1  ORF type:complete len:387 (+),score=121.06 GFYU01021609.1:164-1162(+)
MFPFGSVYRCIVGTDCNTEFTTHFPMDPRSVTAQKGDVIAFDFNRELHYITQDVAKPNRDFRIVLKLHYLAYPTVLAPLASLVGMLTTRYNQAFRALYLATIKPQTWYEKALANYGVILGTKVTAATERHIGWNTIPFYIFWAGVSYSLDNYGVFLYVTSFLHYLRYMQTYYYRRDAAYGIFKRDVLVFKTVSVMQLAYLYLAPYLNSGETSATPAIDVVSLAMIASGYFVSIMATKALGIDGTYFGIELGQVKADYGFVKAFPYNVFPHPMILGQVVALLGMYKVPHVSAAYPALLPIHIILYLIHMTQEIYDFHDGTPWYKRQQQKVKGQ